MQAPPLSRHVRGCAAGVCVTNRCCSGIRVVVPSPSGAVGSGCEARNGTPRHLSATAPGPGLLLWNPLQVRQSTGPRMALPYDALAAAIPTRFGWLHATEPSASHESHVVLCFVGPLRLTVLPSQPQSLWYFCILSNETTARNGTVRTFFLPAPERTQDSPLRRIQAMRKDATLICMATLGGSVHIAPPLSGSGGGVDPLLDNPAIVTIKFSPFRDLHLFLAQQGRIL